MKPNALVAALLTTAAEERLKATRLRSLHLDWPHCFKYFNDQLEREAREHEGLAEVYEDFAQRAWQLQTGGSITRARLEEPPHALGDPWEPLYGQPAEHLTISPEWTTHITEHWLLNHPGDCYFCPHPAGPDCTGREHMPPPTP